MIFDNIQIHAALFFSLSLRRNSTAPFRLSPATSPSLAVQSPRRRCPPTSLRRSSKGAGRRSIARPHATPASPLVCLHAAYDSAADLPRDNYDYQQYLASFSSLFPDLVQLLGIQPYSSASNLRGPGSCFSKKQDAFFYLVDQQHLLFLSFDEQPGLSILHISCDFSGPARDRQTGLVMAAETPPGLHILLHQQVKEHTPTLISSHADRDRVIEVFRHALLKTGPPESFALQAVQEAIKPQKQTVLVQDENQSLENALRTLLQELVSSAVRSGERMMQYGQSVDEDESIRGQIPQFLDIVLHLCERGHIEGGMIFQLLEDLTEMSTMKDCKEIFGYIESKQDILGKQELFGRGKLVMLRTCNQLLRRLSKANDVVFCGRILMFLAHFFPLSERSAVNIKGVFNTTIETKYEKDAPDGISVDFNFYKTFWSLQDHFNNPIPTTLPPPQWKKFGSNLTVVLDTFEAQPLSDDDGNTNHLHQEEEDAAFNTKYLTSSNLMGLELKDPSFRRHILLQCLILFDFLKTPGKNDKDGSSESMKEEIKSFEERVKKLLEVIPPKGKEFLQSIEHILEREKNWVWWKRDGCPAFEKQPIERKIGQEGVKKRKARWRLGNKELSQLWKWADQNPNALTDPRRVRMPSVTEYWKPLGEDMDVSAGIEAEYNHKNNRVYCWKGLRFSARQDLEGFSRFTDHGIEGVVPPELLPPEVRSKFHTKAGDRSKRTKKEEVKGVATHPEDNQVASATVENDGIGSGAELEDGVAPMDSDALAGEVQKQSPDTDSIHEAGQSEADGVDNDTKTDTKMEVDASDINSKEANPTSRNRDSND